MSENKKKIFSLIMAAVLTLIIVVVWYSFTNKSGNDQMAGEEEVSKLSSLSPWQVIKDEFSKAFSSVTAGQTATSGPALPVEVVTVDETATSTATTTVNIVN